MILDDEIGGIIRTVVDNFKITPDKLAVSRINESLSTLAQARDLRVREAESALKKLSRTHTTLSTHHADLVSSHSPTSHASSIASLDTQKFRTAKTANDLEIETERLSSQLIDLQSRLQELEQQGIDGEGVRRTVDDEVGLKLKVYRGMGVEIEREGGEYRKAVVRNGRLGDVHVVNLDGKFSRFFYANYFWGTL